MTLTTIEHPMARIALRWRTAAEGGRRSGPPTAAVYATTCCFPSACEGDPVMSILIEATPPDPDGRATARVGFLAPHLAAPHLRPGARILVLEGPRVVAEAVVLPGAGP